MRTTLDLPDVKIQIQQILQGMVVLIVRYPPKSYLQTRVRRYRLTPQISSRRS